jgi:hypothetical protein
VSLEAYIWAANLPLRACGSTPFRVLLQLADRADPLGYGAYPSVRTIASTLECSERTVQRALSELRETGLIRYGDQRFVAHIPADRRPAVYDVLTPSLMLHELRQQRELDEQQQRDAPAGDDRHELARTG